MQWWRPSSSKESTPLFIDLIDDINQRYEEIENSPYLSRPNDSIYGYSLQIIESVVLKDAYGLTSLRNELKRHKPNSVTDAQIDEYLTLYFNN